MRPLPAAAKTFLIGTSGSVLFLFGLLLHKLIQVVSPDPLFVVDNVIETSIPFVAWTVWIYFLFFPFCAWTCFVVDKSKFKQLLLAWLIVCSVGWLCVLIIPVSFDRPDTDKIADAGYRAIYKMMYHLDADHITFPCLHTAITWTSWFFMAEKNRLHRRLMLVVVIAISISTMTVKQHLLIDNVVAILLAWACSHYIIKFNQSKT